MNEYLRMLFEGEWDSGEYADFSSTAANAVAGKDVLLAVWNKTGTEILAISGQQSLSMSRTAETNEVITKDSTGSWGAAVSGMKNWSVDTGGVYVKDDESHRILGEAFENGDNVVIKVYNRKEQKGLYGGIACITDYSLDAPYDDSMTYSLSLQGVGKLTDFSITNITHDKMPS